SRELLSEGGPEGQVERVPGASAQGLEREPVPLRRRERRLEIGVELHLHVAAFGELFERLAHLERDQERVALPLLARERLHLGRDRLVQDLEVLGVSLGGTAAASPKRRLE